MAFKALFIAHVPDADPDKHSCIIETERYYKLFAVCVKNQQQALSVAERFVKEHGVQTVLLCPGFTHENVAEIFKALGGKAGVFVARGDTQSNNIAAEVLQREGWFEAMRESS